MSRDRTVKRPSCSCSRYSQVAVFESCIAPVKLRLMHCTLCTRPAELTPTPRTRTEVLAWYPAESVCNCVALNFFSYAFKGCLGVATGLQAKGAVGFSASAQKSGFPSYSVESSPSGGRRLIHFGIAKREHKAKELFSAYGPLQVVGLPVGHSRRRPCEQYSKV